MLVEWFLACFGQFLTQADHHVKAIELVSMQTRIKSVSNHTYLSEVILVLV